MSRPAALPDMDDDDIPEKRENCLIAPDGLEQRAGQKDSDLRSFGHACDVGHDNDARRQATLMDFGVLLACLNLPPPGRIGAAAGPDERGVGRRWERLGSCMGTPDREFVASRGFPRMRTWIRNVLSSPKHVDVPFEMAISRDMRLLSQSPLVLIS